MLDLSWATDEAPGLPALLVPSADALVRGAQQRFANRPGNAGPAEQFLLSAGMAQPFIVAGRKRLAGGEAGTGVDEAEFRRLVGFIVAERAADNAGIGTMPCSIRL
jgi:hypothetical protein